MKTIGIASDHAGYELKEQVKKWLEEMGLLYKDFGTHSSESSDYPDYAHPLALAVESGECYPGLAMCGTGNGMSIALNKHQGIRSALCWTEEIAKLARLHNDANIMVMPARFIEAAEALKMVEVFLNSPFEGGRHQKRIDKIPVQ